jgi:hypothetical protein
MGDAEEPMRFLSFDFRFQLGNAAGLSYTGKPAVDHHSQTRRIVAAIFQPPKAFQQDRHDIALGYSSDDSTHVKTP